MYYVYALQSSKNKSWLYIGYSDDLRQRIEAHNKGKVKSAKFYHPLKFVYYEAYLNKNDAVKREYELKHSSQRKEFLKARNKLSLIFNN